MVRVVPFQAIKPAAELAYDLSKAVTAKAAWNFYGYNEKGPSGPTVPRDFHRQRHNLLAAICVLSWRNKDQPDSTMDLRA